MNKSFIEKVKAASQKTFINIGNAAVGNPTNGKKGFVEPVPFSSSWFWIYEKPMPKRKRK